MNSGYEIYSIYILYIEDANFLFLFFDIKDFFLELKVKLNSRVIF